MKKIDLSAVTRGNNIPKKQPKVATRGTNKRAEQEKARFMNTMHPIEFIKDFTEFHSKHKYSSKRHSLTQNELVELAFYVLRQEETGQAIPDWVTRL